MKTPVPTQCNRRRWIDRHRLIPLAAALLLSGCSIAIGITNSPPLPDNGPPRLNSGGPAAPHWVPAPDRGQS